MYKDPEKQREYQRRYVARARRSWLKEHGPCVRCNSRKKLEVDHIDRSTKVSHSVWSWSPQHREAELSKCQVLCSECHKKKTREERRVPVPHGTDCGYTRYSCRCEGCRKAHAGKRRRDYELYGC